jgi:hypothetical protein
MKRCKFIAAIMAATLVFSACGNTSTTNDNNAQDAVDTTVSSSVPISETGTLAQGSSIIDIDDLFSDRDLSGEYDASECESITLADNASQSDAKGVTIDGNTITITKEGDYILEGSLSNGMVIVDVDKSDKVQLVLNGVDINSDTSAAIYVAGADKVFVTLADGTQNTLSNGGSFVAIDDNNIDAVIFSKDDLTLNGTGSLTINSPAGHGVVSKDDLVIANGTYNITASSHGFAGKDSVAINNGTFNVTAGKDGIHSENDDDDEVGYVYIGDGSFNFSVESDGISAVNEIYIAGGNIVISKSYEGLEARLVNIVSGVINITSSDDGINATDKRSTATSQSGENIELKDMSENKEQEQPPEIPDGQEQPQGQAPEMPDGQGQDVQAPEMPDGQGQDGQEQPQGQKPDNNGGGFGGRGGFGGGGFGGGDPMGDTQEDANINIAGGIIYINAEGDGVDSNGYFTMSGGELYVTGPSNGGNGALDYGISATITGGIVVAAGQSDMAVNFDSDSTQGSILVNTSSQNESGTQIVLTDSNGNKLIEWTMEKRYNSVVISCPDIVDGGTYTVQMGDNSTEVTMDGLIYGSGFGMGGGFGGGKDASTFGGGREVPIESDSNNTKKE